MKHKVLHITPHISGGVGSVLLSTLKFYKNSKSFDHEIIAFENLLDSERKFFKGYLRKITRTKNFDIIKKKIENSDIIQIEWWSHPLIYEFLIKFNFPKCRVIICSHIAGFYRPNLITKNVVNFCDYFLATSKATRENRIFLKNKKLNSKLRFIDFPINFERFKGMKKTKHKDFNIGYVGTLDYSKLHNNFLNMCSKINIPYVKFIICGNDLENKIFKESVKYNKTDFQFRGFTNNLRKIFSEIDIFGYPLNRKHFGTGEQVLREAMYAKLPIVAFDNPCERNIITHKKNGILVKNKNEYIDTIIKLSKNIKERKRLGNNAHKTIKNIYSTKRCFKSLDSTYQKTLKTKKNKKNFNFNIQEFNLNSNLNIGAKIFIESLGNKATEFINSYKYNNLSLLKKADDKIARCEKEMKVKNKGSLFQYLRYFPKDNFLNYWGGIIRLHEGKLEQANKLFKSSNISKKRLIL